MMLKTHQIKDFFLASGDDKGIRDQVRLFLQDKTISYEGSSADFRMKCLAELKAAKKAGWLSQTASSQEIARQTASFKRYTDLKGLEDGAGKLVAQIADDLDPHFPNLSKLLRQRPAGGAPLLVSAFAYFFRLEVEADAELARALIFDGLRQLSASQEKALSEVNKALISLGDKLDRIENIVVATHDVVLDIQVEQQRLRSLPDEVRSLGQQVQHLVSQLGIQKGEVKPQFSFSIRSDSERAAVKQLLAQFRQLPSEQQNQYPALRNGLGKLQFGSGITDRKGHNRPSRGPFQRLSCCTGGEKVG
jgi:hypothetical protein